jgi:hypothetical protein
VRNFLLLARAAARNEIRWARQHLYFLLILGPLVVGVAVFTIDQATSQLPNFRLNDDLSFVGFTVLFLALFAAGVSRAANQIYHVRRSEAMFESLPVGLSDHLSLAFGSRLIRAVAIATVVLLARSRFTGYPLTQRISGCGFLLAETIAVTELICGLAWIHWIHLRHRKHLFAGVAFGAAVAVASISAVIGGELIGILFLPARFAYDRLDVFTAIMSIWVLVLLLIVRRMHNLWRARDIEFALRLGQGKAWPLRALRPLASRFGEVIFGIFRRDVLLTVRVFSSTVYVAAALLISIAVLLFTVLRSGMLPNEPNPYGWIGDSWLIPVLAVKAACVLGLLAVMAITPMLVAYQLPHLWLERVVGSRGLDLWRAKLYFTRFITLPVPILIWAVGIAAGAAPANYAVPLLLECLWLWWMLTTIVGSLAFEIPDRPGLALLLTNLLGFGTGMFMAWLWPVGIVAYIFGSIRGLRERGISRANYCLLVGES